MLTNQTCSHCGAPIYENKSCEFCGDVRVEADRQLNCRTFITHVNNKLAEIPPLAGWAMLLLMVALPILIILSGFLFAKSVLVWIILVICALISIQAVIFTAAILRENYQKKLFYTTLFPFIENFIQDQKYSLPEFIAEARHALPDSKQPFLKYVTETMAMDRAQYLSK
jgi:hypothetical protein